MTTVAILVSDATALQQKWIPTLRHQYLVIKRILRHLRDSQAVFIYAIYILWTILVTDTIVVFLLGI